MDSAIGLLLGFGWRVVALDGLAIIFWGSRSGERIAGNGPFIYNMKTSETVSTGTAHSIGYYADNYLSTGNPYTPIERDLRIIGWKLGAKVISAIKILRKYTNCNLITAKQQIDSIIGGGQVSVVLSSQGLAEEFIKDMEAVNFVVRLVIVNSAQQVDSAEASTIAVPPSDPSGSPR
jgi:hypothetical protein